MHKLNGCHLLATLLAFTGLAGTDAFGEHPHHRPLGDERRFLMNRHTRRAIGTEHFKIAAGFLSRCRLGRHGDEQWCRHCERPQIARHLRPPLLNDASPLTALNAK